MIKAGPKINVISTVVSQSTLSDMETFQVLRKPLNVIQSIPLIAQNYLIAYQKLNDRYKNLRNIDWNRGGHDL